MLRTTFYIINLKTLLVAGLAAAATYGARRYGVVAEFPLALIGTAVVFPIVFSISGAYKRRERALDEYGGIKAHGRALYYATRDWLETPAPELLAVARERLGALMLACRDMFTGAADDLRNEQRVYSEFAALSRFVRQLREAGLPSGECSRCNQFVSKMVISFENVKHIYQYRTPRTLRAYSKIFVVLLPILYGPYFAYIYASWHSAHVALLYAMPVLFAVVLVSLDNIQDHLEDPFDQIGEDDVSINAEKFVASLDL